MQSNLSQRLVTIGFGGDGDEVAAIDALERHFGVALDDRDAPHWKTAGDVFGSLLRALPPERRNHDELWQSFTAIMCDETGTDASRVALETLLLALPLRVVITRWLRRLFGSHA